VKLIKALCGSISTVVCCCNFAARRLPPIGLLPYRELDNTLGLTDTGANTLADARTGKNGRHRDWPAYCVNRYSDAWPAMKT
jgi:hypothetical protein